MDNTIVITFKEKKDTGEHDYHITFESNPSLSELCAAYLVLKECLYNNFDQVSIYTKCAALYDRIMDIEEVLRIP